MPTYVYRCEQCGHRFEAWQHMTDDPLTLCPQCGGPIHRVLFPAGIVFKGAGFYSTDHRPTAVATENGTPAAETAKKSDTAAESTKPETAAKPDTPAPADAPARTEKSSGDSKPTVASTSP